MDKLSCRCCYDFKFQMSFFQLLGWLRLLRVHAIQARSGIGLCTGIWSGLWSDAGRDGLFLLSWRSRHGRCGLCWGAVQSRQRFVVRSLRIFEIATGTENFSWIQEEEWSTQRPPIRVEIEIENIHNADKGKKQYVIKIKISDGRNEIVLY